jgi:2-iminobutanoate/2-iminopropanoate deaminase
MKKAALRFLVLAALVAFSAESFAQGSPPATPPPMKYVTSDSAPKAIGPYSQAVVAGGFLFASGQIPIDPKTGDLVGGTIEQSTERVFDNLEAVLKAAGLGFADVVKTTVYLTKGDDFAAMNKVYAKRMGENKPARSTLFVAGLPKGSPIEIDLIALAKK